MCVADDYKGEIIAFVRGSGSLAWWHCLTEFVVDAEFAVMDEI